MSIKNPMARSHRIFYGLEARGKRRALDEPASKIEINCPTFGLTLY